MPKGDALKVTSQLLLVVLNNNQKIVSFFTNIHLNEVIIKSIACPSFLILNGTDEIKPLYDAKT
jgi:hypothetical protein